MNNLHNTLYTSLPPDGPTEKLQLWTELAKRETSSKNPNCQQMWERVEWSSETTVGKLLTLAHACWHTHFHVSIFIISEDAHLYNHPGVKKKKLNMDWRSDHHCSNQELAANHHSQPGVPAYCTHIHNIHYTTVQLCTRCTVKTKQNRCVYLQHCTTVEHTRLHHTICPGIKRSVLKIILSLSYKIHTKLHPTTYANSVQGMD